MDQKKAQPANADWVIHSAQPGAIHIDGCAALSLRGSLRHSVPGNTLVLHPDQLRDGMAGTDAGFRYRMAFVYPALIQNAIGGKPLPIIAGRLSNDPRLYHASEAIVRAMNHPLETLWNTDFISHIKASNHP
ncbi:hypothetical protein IFT91_00565 [Pseudomonas fluorescens]|nr:hypothetical protein [Pseudomonas fluorescens]